MHPRGSWRSAVGAIAGVVALATGATACSSTSTLSAGAAEEQIASALEARVGTAPTDVTCPGDLTAQVGQRMDCTLEDDGTTYGVGVEITSIDDGVATFDIQVDEEPRD